MGKEIWQNKSVALPTLGSGHENTFIKEYFFGLIILLADKRGHIYFVECGAKKKEKRKETVITMQSRPDWKSSMGRLKRQLFWLRLVLIAPIKWKKNIIRLENEVDSSALVLTFPSGDILKQKRKQTESKGYKIGEKFLQIWEFSSVWLTQRCPNFSPRSTKW